MSEPDGGEQSGPPAKPPAAEKPMPRTPRWQRVKAFWGIETFADPPHPVAIVLALVQPTVTFIAALFAIGGFIIATRSLETSQRAVAISEQNLKVAQRAYVAIQNGKFFLRPGPRILNPPGRWDNNMFHVPLSMDIVNLGNTPADLLSLDIKPSIPKGWLFAEDDNALSFSGVGYVAPRSTFPWGTTLHISVPPESMRGHYRPRFKEWGANQPPPGDFELTWTLVYRDVFGGRHAVQWCWADTLNSPYPAPCARDFEGRVNRPKTASP